MEEMKGEEEEKLNISSKEKCLNSPLSPSNLDKKESSRDDQNFEPVKIKTEFPIEDNPVDSSNSPIKMLPILKTTNSPIVKSTSPFLSSDNSSSSCCSPQGLGLQSQQAFPPLFPALASLASSSSAFSPVRPVPLLFQPFLSTSPSSQRQDNVQQKPLPFSVDNILRPNFGKRHVKEEINSSNDNLNPVDLSPNFKKKEEERKSPVGLGSTSGSNAGDGDGDVPPGMVRGPNGQLWPAWVFCTRYSDRPSSGE